MKKQKPGGFRQRMDEAAAMANAAMAKLPTTAIVATIDTMIGVLNSRGIKIRDWDDKDKVVQKISPKRKNPAIAAGECPRRMP